MDNAPAVQASIKSVPGVAAASPFAKGVVMAIAKDVPQFPMFRGLDLATVAVNHSPLFFADESALETGVRAMANLATDYLAGAKPRP